MKRSDGSGRLKRITYQRTSNLIILYWTRWDLIVLLNTAEVPNYVNYSKATKGPIGIDLGIKTLAALSTGKTYKNIIKLGEMKRLEKRFKRLQRKASRKYHMNKEGSRYRKTRNLIKLEERIAKIRSRLMNIRKDYIHKMTTEIVKTKPSHIVIEDLNVKE